MEQRVHVDFTLLLNALRDHGEGVEGKGVSDAVKCDLVAPFITNAGPLERAMRRDDITENDAKTLELERAATKRAAVVHNTLRECEVCLAVYEPNVAVMLT